MIKYIFFDFDGTISDAKRLAYDKMSETLDEEGAKYSKAKLRKLMGAKTIKILEGLGVKKNNLKKVRKIFYKKFIAGATKKNLKVCVSLKPLYKLKKKGYKLIVLSNARKKYLTTSVKNLEMKDLFDGVYGSKPNKTKDKLLKKLFKKYKIGPKEVIYVGDRFSDIDYAHKAHCHAVAIHNKCAWSTMKEIAAEKPDYIIKDFKDLEKLVRKLNH
jgi:phosphoglycolate phosphatase-like HAD superfamily hydrolase